MTGKNENTMPENDDKADKNQPELSDFDPRQNMDAKSSSVLNREVFYKGKTVIEQGNEGFRAYYIERGKVEVLINDGVHQLKISELGPGNIFGEMALIDNEPRSATIKVLEECTLTVISRSQIEGKIKGIGDKAMIALINTLACRLRETTQGQLTQYKNLANFQDRIAGIVNRIGAGVSKKDREKFREEVEPVLDNLQEILDRYQL